MPDFILASLHHLLVFSLAGILAAELVLVRPGLERRTLRLVGVIDGAYGGLAMAVILVGIGRVVWGLKGWEFYVHNPVFWLKMAAFAAVGLLSIAPTLRILAWRRAAAADPDYEVPAAAIGSVRGWLKAEAAAFATIPVIAAALARGIGA